MVAVMVMVSMVVVSEKWKAARALLIHKRIAVTLKA